MTPSPDQRAILDWLAAKGAACGGLPPEEIGRRAAWRDVNDALVRRAAQADGLPADVAALGRILRRTAARLALCTYAPDDLLAAPFREAADASLEALAGWRLAFSLPLTTAGDSGDGHRRAIEGYRDGARAVIVAAGDLVQGRTPHSPGSRGRRITT